MSELADKAFRRLFPGKQLTYAIEIKYSRKFRPYNANVRKTGNVLQFNFSREWKSVNQEITIGLIQDLLLRILKKKSTTTNIDLYNHFIKNLHISAAKTEIDEGLQKIFDAVNDEYFNNSIDLPNLRWGLAGKTKLATYDYHTDTISVSRIFREAEEDVIAYLLYHEMLHKKMKFSSSSGRSIHHSKQFKDLEKKFAKRDEMEQKLQQYIRKSPFRGFLRNLMSIR